MGILSVQDFSGGITDQAEDAPSNFAKELDNLLISPDGKPYSRYGSRLFFSTDALPGAAARIDTLVNFRGDLTVDNFIGAGNLFALVPSSTEVNLFRINDTGDAFTQITGVAVNGCLDGNATNQTSHTQWKGHLYITNDASFSVDGAAATGTTYPVKVYTAGATPTYYLRTAGLPSPASTTGVYEGNESALISIATATAMIVAGANDIRTKLISHLGKTGTTHAVADITAGSLITLPACTDLDTAILLIYQLLKAYASHNSDAYSIGVPSYHFAHYNYSANTGKNSEYLLPFTLTSASLPVDIYDASAKLLDLYNKFTFHLLFSNDNVAPYESPHKVYDSANYPNVLYKYKRSPSYDELTITDNNSVYALASQFITLFNSHTQSAAKHPTGLQPVVALVPGTHNMFSTISYINECIYAYSLHMYDAHIGAGWSYHVANELIDNRLAEYNSVVGMDAYVPTYLKYSATLSECKAKLLALISKYNSHDNDTVSHNGVTTKFQAVDVPTFTIGNFIYAFCYKYSYSVGNLSYIDRGPLAYVQVTDRVVPDKLNYIALYQPTLFANSGLTSYDVSNVKIEIYRTVGVNFYLVDTIAAPTTAPGMAYLDYTSDAELITREPLYTNGGVVENDPPPQCKFVHVIGDVGYWAYIIDGADTFPSRIRQSIPGDIDSVPGDFYVDIDDELMGLSSCNSKLIAFGKSNVYRIDGQFDLRGQGAMTYEKISDVTGAINNVGCVQTEDALFFLGVDGVYMTDGYKVQKLSDHLNATYLALTNTTTKRRRMVGVYDKTNKLILWTCQRTAASTDNDAWIILDLKRPLTRVSCFTTSSGGTNFSPTALAFFNNQVIRGEALGSVLKHDTSYLSDPKIIAGIPSTVTMKPVIYNYLSPHFSMGAPGAKKWATDFELTAKNVTQLSLQVNSINDGGRKEYSLKQIHFRGNLVWGSADALWGDTSLEWDQHGYIRERRRFSSGHLRFDYKQIQITNAYTNITNSDTLGSGVVNSGANTLVIPGLGIWPSDIIDYFVCFENDDYTTQFPVTIRNSNSTLTFSGTSPASGTYRWKLKGYPKEEQLYLIGYSIPFDLVSKFGVDQVGTAGSQGENS